MANTHDKSLSLSARWIVFAGINLVFKSLGGLARCRALLVRVVVSSLHGDLLDPPAEAGYRGSSGEELGMPPLSTTYDMSFSRAGEFQIIDDAAASRGRQ
ncbi:hypothetical protein NW759_012567 [Fusarium solani]|jgi:hypothetical protein|nr:hypothetical protein NW759_012567 [Fusarium solani]